MADMMGGPFGAFGPFGGGARRGRNNADDSSDSNTATATVNPSAGRTGLATGPVKITADQRLNALLVRANRADLDTIEQLLKVLDQKESPEDISVATKPRMIAVQNSGAQEIADIVKQVYADRLVENPAANQPRGFAALIMGARGGNPGKSKDDVAKMSLGVDPRTNSLIVAAPDALFEEVKQLVGQLDMAAGDQNQTVRVVALHRTSPTAVEQALAAIAGSSVQVSRTTLGTGASPYQPYYNQQQQQPNYSRRRQYGQGQYGAPGQQPGFQPGMGGGYNSPGPQGGNTGSRRGGRSGQFQQPGSPQN